MNLQDIHIAAADNIAAKSYTGIVTPNAAVPSAVVKGGATGITIVNSFYEFGYKTTQRDENSLNVYGGTGQDGYRHLSGALSVRTFDIPSQTMLNDRIEIYNNPTYCVFEYYVTVMGSEVWLWTYERLRSDPNNFASARVCFLRSTDGLVGRSFAAPVVQSMTWPWTAAFHGIVDGSQDGSIKYMIFGGGAPTGLRRANINLSTGALSNLTLLQTKSSLTEGSAINIDRNGTIISLSRLDNGGYVQQSVSTDWGLTFSALVDSGMGAATGAKVTPCIVRSANRARSLTISYNDRGSQPYSAHDFICSLNTQAQALAMSYNTPKDIFTGAYTQGNSRLHVIDRQLGLYMYVTAKENGEPAGSTTTTLMYTVLKDQYSVYNVPPAPWK